MNHLVQKITDPKNVLWLRSNKITRSFVVQILVYPTFVNICCLFVLTFIAPKMKIDEFVNNVDPDEVAQKEPPHQGLLCLLAIF